MCGLTERRTDLWEITQSLSLSHGLKPKPWKPNPLYPLLLCYILSHSFVSSRAQRKALNSLHWTCLRDWTVAGEELVKNICDESSRSSMNLHLKVWSVWFDIGLGKRACCSFRRNVNRQLVEQSNRTMERFSLWQRCCDVVCVFRCRANVLPYK